MHRSTFHADPTMSDLLAAYIRRLSTQVRQLRTLIAEDKPAEIRRIAHQLKGAGKSFGFTPITEYAALIEKKLTENPTLAPTLPDLELLLTYMQNVEGYQP